MGAVQSLRMVDTGTHPHREMEVVNQADSSHLHSYHMVHCRSLALCNRMPPRIAWSGPCPTSFPRPHSPKPHHCRQCFSAGAASCGAAGLRCISACPRPFTTSAQPLARLLCCSGAHVHHTPAPNPACSPRRLTACSRPSTISAQTCPYWQIMLHKRLQLPDPTMPPPPSGALPPAEGLPQGPAEASARAGEEVLRQGRRHCGQPPHPAPHLQVDRASPLPHPDRGTHRGWGRAVVCGGGVGTVVV